MNCTARAWVLVAALAWGCAGDGTGLDSFGNPVDPSKPALAPTLSSLQANVFTPICTQCHTGSAAPHGLALDAGVARGNLVDVPSVERGPLMRVRPGEPDSSYIVWKIEGRTTISGGRMPLGLQPLSPDVIAAIRTWIQNGAPNN
jgi:hypothetical protein